jgi:hypothetical protein
LVPNYLTAYLNIEEENQQSKNSFRLFFLFSRKQLIWSQLVADKKSKPTSVFIYSEKYGADVAPQKILQQLN